MNFRFYCSFKSLFFLPAILLAACTPHQQYRTNYETCISNDPESACSANAIQEYKDPAVTKQDYLLGFIEFDDQGQLWDRKQMGAFIDKLYIDSASQDLLIVVFVHGWKHSAKVKDTNIRNFRKTLKRLSAMESTISDHSGTSPRKIVGVYLGWRGGSITAPLIKELTFWDRKNTAHKVGYGDVTEVLSRLELLRKTKRAQTRLDDRNNQTYLVVVGHSFGGAVVYSAVSELLEKDFVHTLAPDGQVSNTVGIGDLVVLINPAFEAIRYSALRDMSTERRTYFPEQLPLVATLTSEADYATKYAFPAGRYVSTAFEKERKTRHHNPVTKQEEIINQGQANVTTIGHFDDYLTHYLKADAPLPAKQATSFNLSKEINLFVTVADNWENDKPGSSIKFEGSTLERTMNSAGRNPYLNIRVDKNLIPDHNSIYDPRIESFVRQLILISSQSPQLENRKKTRSKVSTK